jgi:glucokinase
VTMTEASKHTLAIDIGGTKFSVAAFCGEQMVQRESRSTDREGGREWMLGQLMEIARSWQRDLQFCRCGIGFGGPVDFEKQVVARSTHVGGWSNFPLTQFIKDELGIPAIVDNDANVGVLAEAACGAGRGFDPLFYMTISTGIGGGMIAGGKVLRGVDGLAGEIGHVPLQPDGPECLCGGRGCLERLCSGLWLERDFGRSAKDLMQNPEFVRKYVVNLAQGLRIVTMLLNPARIVIGGGLSKAQDRLFVPLREELKRQLKPWPWATVDVVPSPLGDDNILRGANVLAATANL